MYIYISLLRVSIAADKSYKANISTVEAMSNNSTPYTSEAFITKANRFIQKTQEHALQGVNPGGVYQAIWCRDASYILRDWFLSGNIDGVCQQIYQIWSHQISPNQGKVSLWQRVTRNEIFI